MSRPVVDYHCPDAEYRASEGLSYSESKLLARSPAHYRWMRDHPKLRPAPTYQMILGTMLHCALLEPARFERDYVLAPNVSKLTNAYKDFAQACVQANQRPITEEDRDKVFGMRDALRTHPRISQVLADGRPEVSCWWTADGVRLRARLDWVAQMRHGTLPCDVKTTADASPEAFARSVYNLAYHRQADWYLNAVEACLADLEPALPMLFIVVESSPPYACASYTLHPTFMQLAATENARLRALYKHCMEFDDWPAYDTAITELKPPRWALDADMRRELDIEEATE